MAQFDVNQTQDGEEYAVLKDYDMILHPEYVEFEFKNLFGGNKELGDAVNKLLNYNWKIVMRQLGRPAVRYLGRELNKVVTALCDKIPLKQIFT